MSEEPDGSGAASGELPTPRAPREGDRTWISIRESIHGEATSYWCVYRAASGTWEQEGAGEK